MIDASMACSSMASIDFFCACGSAGSIEVRARVEEARRAEGHRLGDVGLRGDLADLLADEIELGDRLAELLALARELDAQLEAVLGAAHRADPQLPAPDVEDVEGDLVPLADVAEHVLDRDRAVLEKQRAGRAAADPELVLLGPDGEPGRAALDEEGGELLAVDLGEDGEEVGEARVRDVELRTGELPALAVGRLDRLGLGRQRVRARAGLGQRVGGDHLARGELGEILLPLLVGAEVHERHRPDPDVGAEADRVGALAAAPPR